MTSNQADIGKYVAVRSHPTVVRLQDLDGYGADWLSESFLLTPEVKNHLQVLTRLMAQKTGTGVFLIGHYGSGKSHFLAYLSQQLRSRSLSSEPPAVFPVSLVNYSAANRLEDIISGVLQIPVSSGDRRPVWDTMLESHPRGVLLVVDELSEFLRAKTDPRAFTEDVRFLQFIGEWAQDRPCWIIAALQEGIEHTGELEYDLYRKIKDRYPYRLLLSPAHVKALIADSILIKKNGYEAAVETLIRELSAVYPSSALDFDVLRAIYPVHPSTLELLEEVRDRFSQARGIVDFTVTRLRGEPARGMPGFVERPFGELLTPDVIVDHFKDLFELQPEFLPLAQQVFPWYRKHLPDLFERPALRTLAERLLKLLVLVHLSPRREWLSAQEAATWLLFSATRVEPQRNRKIIERIFSILCERGRYVSAKAGRFRLDLRDDGGATLERVLQREIAQLEGQQAVILETLVPLLPTTGFNPFVLPRDQWQHRQLSWHFHERRFAVWLGHRRPEPVEGIALCLRLPWGEGGPMPGGYTLLPAATEINADLVELAALTRLRERPGNPELHERIRQRLEARAHLFTQAVRSAWQESRLISPEGKAEAVPRLEAKTTLDAWLDTVVLWILRRRYPAFERFAPQHGPLPKVAWLRLMRFCSEHDIGSAEADDYVKLIREAYLIPMGLLRRKGREYQIPAGLDRHELVRLIAPLLEHNPSPRAVHDHLSEPIYGLVPDQINLLLIFLLLQGEIDILKGRSSYRECFETLPNPLHYDRLVPGHALGMDRLNELQRLCEGLNIRIPSQWSVMLQRHCANKLLEWRGRQRETLQPLIRQLGRLEQGRGLAERIQRHLDLWNALDKGEHLLQGLEQFLFEITPVDGFLEELRAYARLPERLQRLLDETRRYIHLLQHPGLAKLLPELDTLRGEGIPTLEEPELMEDWVRRASQAYDSYKRLYRQRHELWWKEISEHPLWDWRSPALARSRHLNLTEILDEIERCRQQAAKARCPGLANLDYQAQCSCGFDGETAPIGPLLERFDSLTETLETRLRLFFQQDEIKSRLRDWQREGVEMHTDTISYLEGRRAIPKIRDVESLDRYLSGAELATEMEVAPVVELLCQRLWQPAELLQALERLLVSDGKQRLRFTGNRGGEIPNALVEWCARQSLSFGVPLPEGLGRKTLSTVSRSLRAEWVSPQALFRLEELGLDREGVRRVLRWLVDGHIPLPDSVPEGSLLDAVAALLQPPVVHSPGP